MNNMEISKKKLLLIAVDPGRKKLAPDEVVYVRINSTYGQMMIGKAAQQAMAMDGKLYKLFYDTANNVIAWQIKDAVDGDELFSKTWKLVKADPTNGVITIGIKRVLEAIGKSNIGSVKLRIKKSSMKENLLDSGEYYFIEFNEEL